MRLSTLNEAAPIANRLNEDTCYVRSNGTETLVMVADGAGQRLSTTKTDAMLNWLGTPITAARFAALTILNAARDYDDPQDILLQANENIAWNWEHIYGELSAAALCQHEPQLAADLNDDARLIRLALPVCVATAVRINSQTRQLDYAHVGDTMLLIFHDDGRISTPTTDQMGIYDERALAMAVRIQAETGAPHMVDVVADPRVVEINRRNGLYHNYVDEQGKPDVKVGVGVINGLPEMEAYMECGSIDLHDVSSILLSTDGGLWPAPLNETPTDRVARYQHMRELIECDGLTGYYEQLRAIEAADSAHDRYPRFKTQDDCTAVFVEF